MRKAYSFNALRRNDPLRWSKSLNDLRIQKNVNFLYDRVNGQVQVSYYSVLSPIPLHVYIVLLTFYSRTDCLIFRRKKKDFWVFDFCVLQKSSSYKLIENLNLEDHFIICFIFTKINDIQLIVMNPQYRKDFF